MAGLRSLVLDLDGTLIDSVPAVAAAVNVVLAENGRETLAVDAVKAMVGRGALATIEEALDATGGRIDGEAEDLMDRYLEAYLDDPAASTLVYPNVVEILSAMQTDGIRLGICTNKPEATCFPVLEAFDLKKFFPTVICGDTLEFRKPDPRHVFHTLDVMGARRDDATFIGDSEADIEAANNANLPSILVSFGYCHVPFENLKTDAVIDHFDELDDCLNNIAAKRKAS